MLHPCMWQEKKNVDEFLMEESQPFLRQKQIQEEGVTLSNLQSLF